MPEESWVDGQARLDAIIDDANEKSACPICAERDSVTCSYCRRSVAYPAPHGHAVKDKLVACEEHMSHPDFRAAVLRDIGAAK